MRESKTRRLAGWLSVFAFSVPGAGALAAPPARLNGFVLSPASIPVDEIHRGGPPRDGIPALDLPRTVPADAAPWSDDERVVGVAWPGGARAYPISILVWHELVNDRVGERPILVSYCPLCGTAMVFDRRVGGDVRRFGVSGLLYQSDLLMFDRETHSLWSQISGRAVTGVSLAQHLTLVRSRLERWGRWRREHPETTVLSKRTGHRRRYDRSPYDDYDSSRGLMFPAPLDPRYHPKMRTLGLRHPGGTARGYPLEELQRAGGRVDERFEGLPVTIRYDSETEVFEVEAPDPIEVVEAFWFAWVAFHPETSVFVATSDRR